MKAWTTYRGNCRHLCLVCQSTPALLPTSALLPAASVQCACSPTSGGCVLLHPVRAVNSASGFDWFRLDVFVPCRLRIYHYYLPVFFWVQQELQQHKQKHAGQTVPPLVVSSAHSQS